MQPITDTTTIVTATIYSTPTTGFSTTANLTYCDSCGHYQQVVNLPADAPLGNYQVDLVASHPGYDPAQVKSVFFVTPPLTMTLEATPSVLSAGQQLTLTARLYQREVVTEANIFAEIASPGGVITVPLVYDGMAYRMTLRPVDLEPNLGAAVASGQWEIRATADYYGSTASASATAIVLHKVYLPLVLKH